MIDSCSLRVTSGANRWVVMGGNHGGRAGGIIMEAEREDFVCTQEAEPPVLVLAHFLTFKHYVCNLGFHLSPSSMRVPGVEVRLKALAACAVICWVSLALSACLAQDLSPWEDAIAFAYQQLFESCQSFSPELQGFLAEKVFLSACLWES